MGRHRWAGPAQCRGRTFILWFSTLLCIISNGGEIQACTKAESEALLQFKARITNDSNLYLENWMEGSDCCVWRGVICGIGNISVTELSLAGAGLQGIIPSSIGNLSLLTVLDLSGNQLVGSIPDSVGYLAQLTQLYLYENKLGGVIPPSLGMLPVLEEFMLQNNNLTGRIPSSLGNISAATGGYLFDFLLGSNDLSGSIPASIGNLSVPTFHNSLTLEKVKLGGNSFHGAIPDSFSSFRSLQSLHASQNRLTDSLPLLKNCPNLTVVDVSWNQLSGPVPSWLEGLSGSLRVLMLGSNRFEGPFPAWLGSLLNLQVLDISNNKISGTFPADLNRLRGYKKEADNHTFDKLEQVLYEDQIVVIIKGYEVSYSYILSSVTSFDVSHNDLTGPIPSVVGDLTGLRYLNLTSNRLSGSIPSSLGNISLLESLDLSSNDLTGSIPTELTSLRFLSSFNVSSNQLSGQIPQGFQFSTFSNSSYLGNSGLCGYPLEQCLPLEPEPILPDPGLLDVIEKWISFLGLLMGFMMGFIITWVVILRFLKSKRYFLRFKSQGQPESRTSYGAYHFP
ncbi:hypothetical protein Mapa_015685 [Marchantia paleacea]|nr:hypothetical protein Mapa_015685 [Marchantia paleacea]